MIFLKSNVKRTQKESEKVEELQQLIQASNELHLRHNDDVLLSKFLTFSQWNVERAYNAIHKYYDFKRLHPDWVARRPVESYRELFCTSQTKFLMPHSDKNGRALIVFKMIDVFDHFPNFMQDQIEMDDLIFESLLLLPSVQEFGITVICDLRQASTKFLRMLTPSFIRLINLKHEALPFRNRILHIIQSGFILTATSSVILPLMSKDIKEKLIVHNGKDFNKLRDMIGYDSLPAEYGGPPQNVLDVNIIFDHLLHHAKYLEQLQKYEKRVTSHE